MPDEVNPAAVQQIFKDSTLEKDIITTVSKKYYKKYEQWSY